MSIAKSPILGPPNGEKRVLLHSCCAVCAGAIMATLQESGIAVTVLFYNPNIHPRQEYEIRKEENKRFAAKLNIPFIDADYDPQHWLTRIKGLELEPERGARCTVCFDLRLERTALYAYEHGFTVFTSSAGISRWKNLTQVNESGLRVATRYPGMTYWTYNWRKQGGSQQMIELAKREQFYRQDYCGCVYSWRETAQRRKAQGRIVV